jgi:superoxide dismutase
VGGDEDLGEDLAEAITWGFGSLESLKEQFVAAAAPGALFGSGWAWLIVNPDRSVSIETTANQDSPLMEGRRRCWGWTRGSTPTTSSTDTAAWSTSTYSGTW